MSSLGSREKLLLLEVARRALTVAVERRELLDLLPQEPSLSEPAGAFVTLHCRGRLRGCVGQIDLGRSLVEVVAHSAKAAAVEDTRFDPVSPDELGDIEIELSVLSPLEEISLDQIEAGKHGLIVSRGWQRGLLLPQVATERGWEARRFLEETCVKAGLERDAWKNPGTRIQGFTAEIFSESNFRTDRKPDAEASAKSNYSTST
jgi:AmmeMemoRadiSam system protein A